MEIIMSRLIQPAITKNSDTGGLQRIRKQTVRAHRPTYDLAAQKTLLSMDTPRVTICIRITLQKENPQTLLLLFGWLGLSEIFAPMRFYLGAEFKTLLPGDLQ